MKNTTNINIIGESDSYNYIIEYDRSINDYDGKISYHILDDSTYNVIRDNINIYLDEYCNCHRFNNEWRLNGKAEDFNIESNSSKITLLIPLSNVGKFINNVKYAFNIWVYIGAYQVNLGSYIIDSTNFMALSNCVRKLGNSYYECVVFDILDPVKLLYGDNSYKEFREKLCKDNQYNSFANTSLNFSLHPVEYYDGRYIKINGYTGGQNSINLLDSNNNYLRLNLWTNYKTNPSKECPEFPLFECKLQYNEYYKSIQEYLKDVYLIKDEEIEMDCTLALRDSNNIYNSILLRNGIEYWDDDNVFSNIFELNSKDDEIYWTEYWCGNIFDNEYIEINWDWWKEYHENNKNSELIIQAIVRFYIPSENEEKPALLYLKSNEIPVTQELFSYFIKNNDKTWINIKEINDMNIYNINAVDKTEYKVYKLNNPTDAKSNIIQPVFFKVYDLPNIIIHPNVTENICLNLDQYKSKVKSFTLLLENIPFGEIGRNTSGVIFKIIGKKLPQNNLSGTYYIINQDEEIITSGKYTYEL